MSNLPTVIAPEHELKLWSLKTPVKFRPYLVKEEKIMLMAQQSGEKKDIERAVKQIIRNCTFGAVAVETLPTFDVEMLFLHLRARSVSNRIDVNFTCQNSVGETDARCKTAVPLTIDIDDIKLTVPEGHTNKFWLTDDLGVTLKYPTADVFDGNEPDVLNILARCLETVFTKTGDVYEAQETPPEQVTAFVESLTITQVDMLRTFFETMPRVEYTVKFVCPKCGYTEDIVLKGLTDFFD